MWGRDENKWGRKSINLKEKKEGRGERQRHIRSQQLSPFQLWTWVLQAERTESTPPVWLRVDRCTQPDIDCNQGRGETLTIHLHPVWPQWCHRLWGGWEETDTAEKAKSQHRCIHQVTTPSVLKIPFLLQSSLQEYLNLAACKRYKAVMERLRNNTQ